MISFTQYLMPDGRRQEVQIERPKEIEDLALEAYRQGWALECEMLPDYETVSFTITDDLEGDLAHELCKNGPEVPEAVDRLLRKVPELVKQAGEIDFEG